MLAYSCQSKNGLAPVEDLVSLAGRPMDSVGQYFTRKGWRLATDTATAQGKYRVLTRGSDKAYLTYDRKQELLCSRIGIRVKTAGVEDTAAIKRWLRANNFSGLSPRTFMPDADIRQVGETFTRTSKENPAVMEEVTCFTISSNGTITSFTYSAAHTPVDR